MFICFHGRYNILTFPNITSILNESIYKNKSVNNSSYLDHIANCLMRLTRNFSGAFNAINR